MTASIIGLLAETPLHPGVGQAEGVVDLPVAREHTTYWPHIPETGLKGALRQWAKTIWLNDEKEDEHQTVKDLFGHQDDKAGELLISTARLLCLPIRQLNGPYAWVTTPMLLERFQRDALRCGEQVNIDIKGIFKALDSKSVNRPNILRTTESGVAEDSSTFLEEYVFNNKLLYNGVTDFIGTLIDEKHPAKDRLKTQIAIISDQEFSWFAQYALPVNARNKLDDKGNKTSDNLWYEEVIPPDALFYTLILPRNSSEKSIKRKSEFIDKLIKQQFLQIGGNETVGQGWVALYSKDAKVNSAKESKTNVAGA